MEVQKIIERSSFETATLFESENFYIGSFGIPPVSSYNIFEMFLQNSWDFQNPCEDQLPEQTGNCVAGDQPPEGSAAFFGGNVWEWVPQVKEYYYHTFSIQQPDLNWKNEKMRQELYAMIRFWMDKGIRGFRLDAIDNIVKDGHGGNDQQSPQIHTYLQEMTRNTFGLRDDILTVGETGGTTLEMAKEYSNPERKELDMVFQFKLMDIDGVRSGNWEPKEYTLPQLKSVMASWQTGLDD